MQNTENVLKVKFNANQGIGSSSLGNACDNCNICNSMHASEQTVDILTLDFAAA